MLPSSSTPIPSGRIKATALSAYDLPESGGDIQPLYISLSTLGAEVKTGPPTARHRDQNSFRFTTSKDTGSESDLVIAAPLSALYPSTLVFRVVYENSKYNLVASCDVRKNLRVNEAQFIILTLEPEQASTTKLQTSRNQDTTDPVTVPTLRLKISLEGPYRPEIQALISLTSAWFMTMDGIADASNTTWTSLTRTVPNNLPPIFKYLLVPTVPLAALSVAGLPILAGLLVIGLPFFLPILIVLLSLLALILGVGTTVYISTKTGREAAFHVLGPGYSTFISTSVGQRFIYETGPRPSPVALAQTVLPSDMMGRLVVSLIIDFVGSSSYLVPVVGESFDLAWAPIQTILIMAMYDDSMPSLKYVSFLEEIIPFTDVLPSATLGWVRQFTPTLLDEGMKKVHDLSVVVRGEKEALIQGVAARRT